jgi:hypothetical protein
MNDWIATERVSFRVFPPTESAKSVAAFLANAPTGHQRVLFVSNGGTKIAGLMNQHEGVTVVPKGPWPVAPQSVGTVLLEKVSRRWMHRIASRMKRKSWARYVPGLVRRDA